MSHRHDGTRPLPTTAERHWRSRRDSPARPPRMWSPLSKAVRGYALHLGAARHHFYPVDPSSGTEAAAHSQARHIS